MEFIVLSRENAADFSYRVKKDCVFISITDPELCKNDFAKNPHIKAILRLAFDDVDGFQDKMFSTDQPMTLTQAKEIANFVLEWKDKVDLIVVHCEAGISRSAGVCAAIMKYLTNDDMPIFNNCYFCPNMFCYRLVLNAFMCPIDETEIQDKEEYNTRIWKIYHGIGD